MERWRMVKHASRVRAGAGATTWLGELKGAHSDLMNAIEELDRLTRGQLPSRSVVDAVRWRVSKASLSRRMLWARIQAHLSELGDACPWGDLRRLQEIDIHLLRASSAHVSQWTTEAILSDWPGYCRASELMRSRMIDAIAGEKRILYPLVKSRKTAQSKLPSGDRNAKPG